MVWKIINKRFRRGLRCDLKWFLLLLILFTAVFFLFIYGLNKNCGLTPKYYERSAEQPNDTMVYTPDIGRSKRKVYPVRQNMGECPQLYGKVMIFVAYVNTSMQTNYRVAQQSIECYLKNTNYTLAMVDLDSDQRIQEACGNNRQLLFKKHCAASVYLRDTDWMLVLDADTGIANPNHCIEEWIDDRVDLLFYERFFNWEIASGNYLARNTQFARNFLKKFGEWEFIQPNNWNGADNGVLQILILQTVIPDAIQEIQNCDTIWRSATDYDTYMAYVTCVKLNLGATRIWPGKLRIYRRAHGWVRDGFLTTDEFCDADFMLHGWKTQEVGTNGWESPFNKNLDPSKCGKGQEGWDHRPNKYKNCTVIRKQLFNYERYGGGANFPLAGRVIPHLQAPDIGHCYPECDKNT